MFDVSAALLVIQGRNQGSRIAIDEATLDLGRGASSGFRILDTEVSRLHATITRSSSGSFEVTDRNSSNGTFVNGKPVDTAPLRGGDQIQIGRTVFLFETTSDEDKAATHAADRIELDGDLSQQSIIAQVDGDATQAIFNQARSGATATDTLRRNLEVLYAVSELVVRPSVGIDELLQQILSTTLEAIGADRGVMLVADPQTDEIKPRVFGGRKSSATGQKLGERMPISRTIVDYVLTRGRGVQTSDAAGDERFAGHESILSSGIREAMCVPMQGRFELLGVIYVDTTQSPGESMLNGGPRFTGEMLMLLASVGRQAALAVENHRYQEALVKAERLAAVGQTVTMLSHHVKNILQGMRGGGYLVEKGLSSDSDDMARRGWGILDRNQERLYNLVMDMLAFSKERQPELEPCAINEVVADVADLMTAAAAEQDVRIRTDLSSDLLITLADREGLHRAILNLVVNAIEAMDARDDGSITLRTRRHDREQIVVEVSDNGPGIEPDALARLFQLFESSKGSRGTGIGLAVSRKILQEHGGDVEVESELGQGTTFRLFIPQRDDPASFTKTGEFQSL